MPEKETHLTAEGRAKLEAELEYLKTVKRPEVAYQIHSAKEEGDIMENSAYDAAKEQQAFVEGRILTIESILKSAKLIEKSNGETVSVGSTVVVKSRDSKETEEYQIVGSAEADPKVGRISNESPIGKALLAKRVGDEITVKIPAGERRLKILEIR